MRTGQVILLVEDNDADAELTAMAFADAHIGNLLVRMKDGQEALDYLFAQGNYAHRTVEDMPTVVLLDLNMPRVSGIEVLKAIRADERIKHLPVIILTSSIEDRDRLAAYDNHANSYVQKPVDYDQFVTASRQLGLYWLLLNQPPPSR
ncbi:MAG TPA: response regulator [Rhodocyclaceae bacterium]|nr:response regulator [Rhodocyclaceae bacterium]